MRKYNKKKTGRKSPTFKVRGGFTVPTGSASSKYAQSVMKRAMYESAKRSKDPDSFLRDATTVFATAKTAVELGSKLYESVRDSGVFGEDAESSAVSSETKSRTTLATGNIGTVYKSRFEVGGGPRASVRAAEAVGGSRMLTQSDTDITYNSPTLRSQLSPAWGFNQKQYVIFDKTAYWDYDDLINLSNAGSTAVRRAKTKNERTYWLTKRFMTDITLYNKNKYLPVTIKVHWLKQTTETISPRGLLVDCFDPSSPLPTSDFPESYGVIPWYEQVTPVTFSGNVSEVSVDPKLGSINHSPAFKENFDKVKTFTKKLRPGESWKMEYIHNTPSGLSWERLCDIHDEDVALGTTSGDASAFYYPLLEFVGPTVECHDSTNEQTSYIGSAPGTVLMSFKKRAEIVLFNKTQVNVIDPAGGGSISNLWAFKSYTSAGTSPSDAIVNRRFNVNPSDILRGNEVAAAGKYIIPVTTEMNVKRAGYDNPG